MAKSPPFWLPGVHAARRPFLLQRGRIAAAFRGWFVGQGFVEVDTATLQFSPGNETHLHDFATALIGPGGERRALYLRTSPEFACKKLLAAGESRIFDFARVFRNRERGALHHPEFTMLEWYRAGEPYEILMDDCGALMRAAAEATETRRFPFRSARYICAPRRNSPARSSSQPASRGFSILPASSGTASGAHCIIRNSRCWSGIAPASPTRS